MSTPPTSDPSSARTPEVVLFTVRGETALDELAGRWVARCDGSVEGIVSLLEAVLEAEVGELAAALHVGDDPAVPEARPDAATILRLRPRDGAR